MKSHNKGGRPRLAESERRSVLRWMRLTPQEAAALDQEAKACGLSVSTYLRRKCQRRRLAPVLPEVSVRAVVKLGELEQKLDECLQKGLATDTPLLRQIRSSLRQITENLTYGRISG